MEFHCIIFPRDVLQNGFVQHFSWGNIFSFEKLPLLGFSQPCCRRPKTRSPAEGRGPGGGSAGWVSTDVPGGWGLPPLLNNIFSINSSK